MIKKYIEMFKYRIKRFITSEYIKCENKMLNNIWKFCEPDFVNDDGDWCFVDSSGQIDISKYANCTVKKRLIFRHLSLDLYEPTTDKYPTKYNYNAVQNRMKLMVNATYGAVYNTVHLTEKQHAKIIKIIEGVTNE